MIAFAFIIPLIGRGLLLASVVGLIVLWIRVLRKPKAVGPSCGKCGYLVQGMSTFSCPECGSDLREVGIDTAKQRGTVRPGGVCALVVAFVSVASAGGVGDCGGPWAEHNLGLRDGDGHAELGGVSADRGKVRHAGGFSSLVRAWQHSTGEGKEANQCAGRGAAGDFDWGAEGTCFGRVDLGEAESDG